MMTKFTKILVSALAALTFVALAGCVVDSPPPRPYREAPPPPPPPRANTDVYAYPQQGQTAEQQDRDRYDCHLWAVQQSNFDPSAPGVPPHERVRVVSAPPSGAGTAVGAIAGAILGAAIAGPRDAGFGAIAGGITGAAVGNASDQAQAAASQQVIVQQDARQAAAMEQKASNYRRAISACLEARGYSVK